MRLLLLAMVIPLAGCFFMQWSSRKPVWSVEPEQMHLDDWSPAKPFLIREKHMILGVTRSTYLVAYDAANGRLLWKTKDYVKKVHGYETGGITVENVTGIAIIDPSTGDIVKQFKVENAKDFPFVQFGEVKYGVRHFRELTAEKDGKTLWTDGLGFIPAEGVFPEMRRGVLVFRGQMAGIAIGFLRVYEPDTGKLLWDLEGEGATRNQPLLDVQLAGDRAVVTREGSVTSRDLRTGRILWSGSSDRPPVVTPDRVFTFDKEAVKVLDSATGRQTTAWMPAKPMAATVTTAADGVVYTAYSESHNTLGGTRFNWTLSALDERSGKELWHSNVDKETHYATPLLIDDKVVIVSDRRIFALPSHP
jgi:outer membrane protein assembly factor BamB